MLTDAELEDVRQALWVWEEGEELHRDIDLLIRKGLASDDFSLISELYLLSEPADFAREEGRKPKPKPKNPLVWCCFGGLGNPRCQWVRADVCAKYGSKVYSGKDIVPGPIP